MEVHRIQPVSNHPSNSKQTSSQAEARKELDQASSEDQIQRSGPLTEKEVAQSVETLNRMSEMTQTHVKFTYHEKMGEYYIQIIDNQKDEVIREIPSKKILDIIASIRETMGLIIDKKI